MLVLSAVCYCSPDSRGSAWAGLHSVGTALPPECACTVRTPCSVLQDLRHQLLVLGSRPPRHRQVSGAPWGGDLRRWHPGMGLRAASAPSEAGTLPRSSGCFCSKARAGHGAGEVHSEALVSCTEWTVLGLWKRVLCQRTPLSVFFEYQSPLPNSEVRGFGWSLKTFVLLLKGESLSGAVWEGAG